MEQDSAVCRRIPCRRVPILNSSGYGNLLHPFVATHSSPVNLPLESSDRVQTGTPAQRGPGKFRWRSERRGESAAMSDENSAGAAYLAALKQIAHLRLRAAALARRRRVAPRESGLEVRRQTRTQVPQRTSGKKPALPLPGKRAPARTRQRRVDLGNFHRYQFARMLRRGAVHISRRRQSSR